jgi:phosphatidylcholine synthase
VFEGALASFFVGARSREIPMSTQLIAAALVHIFTASGVVAALFATLATMEGRFEHAFLWLGVAFVIDGVDGTFARMTKVWERIPRISGETLDLVIDYITYVFIPALMLIKAGYLPGAWGLLLAALICMSSLFHFSDEHSKAADNSFVGFPAIWNIIAFYVFALGLSGWSTAVLVLACVALTFVPLKWVHPMRVKAFMVPTLAASALWAIAACAAIWGGLPAKGWAWWALVFVGVYGIGLTALLGFAPVSNTRKE